MFFRIESPSTNNMENSTNRSVSDNQMVVDGVLKQEKKDQTKGQIKSEWIYEIINTPI